MSQETWRPVLKYEALYEVSCRGRVRRILYPRRKSPKVQRMMATTPNPKGYTAICLCKNGKQTTRTVHTLVLEAFIGPRPDGLWCAHLNGVRDDCRIENLVWATPKENHRHMHEHGTAQICERNTHAKLTNDQAAIIIESTLQSLVLAKKFGVCTGTIRCIRRGQTWKLHPIRAALAEKEPDDG